MILNSEVSANWLLSAWLHLLPFFLKVNFKIETFLFFYPGNFTIVCANVCDVCDVCVVCDVCQCVCCA